MPSGYSRVVEFAATSGTPTCVELPAVPRGVLRRLVIKQVSGTSANGSFSVLDRKGACQKATDLNVKEAGAVTSVTESSNNLAEVTFTAATALKVGDYFEIKGNSNASYNKLHCVVAVNSPTVVVTNEPFDNNGTGGLWQTQPFIATKDPMMHTVYTGSVASGQFSNYSLAISYENSDNQSETMRTRYQALWLEFTPNQNGTFQVAVTTESDAAVL